MQNKSINAGYILNVIISLVIILVAMKLASYYKHLSPNELTHAISGKMGIHQSLSDPNRLYKMIYNVDNTFVMHTMENCATVGTTTGYYKVISNYNVGYIDVTYNEINDSPFIKSMFNKNNENHESIITMQRVKIKMIKDNFIKINASNKSYKIFNHLAQFYVNELCPNFK